MKVIDLGRRDIEIIGHTTKLDLLIVENYIATTIVTIPRLADRTDIDHHLFVVQFELIADFVGRKECSTLGTHAGNMRVALEAEVLDQTEDVLRAYNTGILDLKLVTGIILVLVSISTLLLSSS